MMSKVLLLPLYLTLSQASELETNLNNFFAVSRGVLTGFNRGLYDEKSYKLEAKCLDEEMAHETAFIWVHVVEENFWENIFDIIPSFYTVYSDFANSCPVEDWAFDISSHCFTHKCDTWGMMSYVTRRFLLIMDNAIKVSEAFYMIDSSDVKGKYWKALTIAQALGYITAYSINM